MITRNAVSFLVQSISYTIINITFHDHLTIASLEELKSKKNIFSQDEFPLYTIVVEIEKIFLFFNFINFALFHFHFFLSF